MSDDTATAANDGGAQGDAQGQPTINCLSQYVKDLSFENPNGAAGAGDPSAAPNVDMNVQIGTAQAPNGLYEVTLAIDGKASRDGKDMFVIELHYAGLFQIENIPAEHMEAVLYIHCATLLFPFARQIVAETTGNGGYPPLLLNVIDFTSLYQSHVAQNKNNAGAGT